MFENINTAIPMSVRPIGYYDMETKKIKDENVKFSKMTRYL